MVIMVGMDTTTWQQREAGGFLWLRSPVLAAIDGVEHLFSTRVGSADTDLPGLQRVADLEGPLPTLRQIHGSTIVDAESLTSAPVDADGIRILAGDPHVASIRTADCVPILIADRDARVALAIHAGWRGIDAGILDRALTRAEAAGVLRADLRVALGPAAGGCCYEVGPEVLDSITLSCRVPATEISRPSSGDRVRIDLRRALSARLQAAGVQPSSIDTARHCTICDARRFYSYRRDGAPTGRLMAMVALGRGPKP